MKTSTKGKRHTGGKRFLSWLLVLVLLLNTSAGVLPALATEGAEAAPETEAAAVPETAAAAPETEEAATPETEAAAAPETETAAAPETEIAAVPEPEETAAGTETITADEPAAIDEGDSNTGGTTTPFYKLTDLDVQLVKGGYYIIAVPYVNGANAISALGVDASGQPKVVSITYGGGNTLTADKNGDYVFTTSSNPSGSNAGKMGITVDGGVYRLKLNSSGVFDALDGSGSDVTLTRDEATGTWSVATSSRLLHWTGSAFEAKSSSTSKYEIWTTIAPPATQDPEDEDCTCSEDCTCGADCACTDGKPCDGDCACTKKDDNEDPGEGTFHKMTSKAELTEDSHYIIVGKYEDKYYALTPDAEKYVTEIEYSALPEQAVDERYVFTLSDDKAGAWYFKTETSSLKLTSTDVFAAAGSPGHITVSKSGEGWAVASANRSLLWENGEFTQSTNKTTPGSEVEIWTDAEAVGDDACDCGCAKCLDGCECVFNGACGDADCTCGGVPTTFYKMTGTAQLKENEQYIIVYNDSGNSRYTALYCSDNSDDKYAGYAVLSDSQFNDDGTLTASATAGYVLTLSKDKGDGTYQFKDGNENEDESYRLKLDSTHVFQMKSPGNILVTQDRVSNKLKDENGIETGEVSVTYTGTWKLINYNSEQGTYGRGLTWSDSIGFTVTNSNGVRGSSFEIWTTCAPVAHDCSCSLCGDACACDSDMHCSDDNCDCGIEKKVTVTFQSAEGEEVATADEITAGTTPTYADVPEEARSHAASTAEKIFMGWFYTGVDEDGNQIKIELGSAALTEDITVTAEWLDISEIDTAKFHKITSLDKLKKDAHYIIVVPGAGATATTFGTPVSNGSIVALPFSTTADDNGVDIWEVSLGAPSVMTATSVTQNDGSATVKLQADSVEGANRMKLGTTSSMLTPMFDKNGGSIVLTVDKDGLWTLSNSGRTLRYDNDTSNERIPGEYFKLSGVGTTKFEIWTDDEVEQEQETTQTKRYVEYLPLEWEVTKISQDQEMVIVYDAPDGSSYASTADGTPATVDVSDTTVAVSGEEKTTGMVLTDPANAWTVVNSWLADGTDPQNVLKQGADLESVTFIRTDDNSYKLKFTSQTEDQTYVQYLSWTGDGFTLVTDETQAISVRVFGPSNKDISYTYVRLTDLSQLEYADQFMIVVPVTDDNGNTQRFAIASGSSADSTTGRNWLLPVTLSGEGTILVTESGWATQFTHGGVYSYINTASATYWDYNYVMLSNSSYLRLNNLSNAPYGSRTRVRFAYGDDNSTIYLRGNASDSWLNLSWGLDQNDQLILNGARVDIDYATPIEIYTIVSSEDDLVKVQYHNTKGEVIEEKTFITQGDFTLEHLKDVNLDENGDMVELTAEEVADYIFVGWSWDESYVENAILSLDDSCDLYDYVYEDENDNVGHSGFKSEVKTRLSLLGTGNPEESDVLAWKEYEGHLVESEEAAAAAVSGGSGVKVLNLYPVYAVRGYDSAVSIEDGDTQVVGIADTKGNYATIIANQRWLGKIYVEVYLDGVLWEGSQPMYFAYHNDDAADLNVKFIESNQDNETLDENGKTQLYLYLADEDIFPEYHPVGHYKIDAVIAEQGGSQNSEIRYALNWMSDHGGRLDNVKGGSTVKIYVTSIYNVEYYLDGELIEDFTDNNTKEDDAGNKADYYFSTAGTKDKFAADEAANDPDYHVRVGENDGLMDPEITTGSFTGDQSELVRGGYWIFSYWMKDRDQDVTLAGSPESLVPAGKKLYSTQWSLMADGQKTVTVDFGGSFTVGEGGSGAYGQGNTVYAYADPNATGEPADTPYTYHLYAFTAGDLEVTKSITGTDKYAQKDKEFTFTVTLGGAFTGDDSITGASINGAYGDMTFVDGVATITLKAGETKTAEGLPPGVTYEVEETSDEDYELIDSTGTIGTITSSVTLTAAFVNERGTGDLVVSKTVAGRDGDTDQDFSFTVTLSEDITDTFGDMEFENGVAEFTLKHGESKTAEGLPSGVSYTVEEEAEGYTTTSTGETGSIVKNDTVEAAFTNTRDTGNLTVSKKVTGTGGDTKKAFTFTVTLSDKTINGEYGDMTFKDGVATFTLKHGESKTAEGLPTGVTYTVTESDNSGYTVKKTGDTGEIEKDKTAEAAFTNNKDKAAATKTTAAKTGDDSNLLLWAALLMISLSGMICFLVYSKKRGKTV